MSTPIVTAIKNRKSMEARYRIPILLWSVDNIQPGIPRSFPSSRKLDISQLLNCYPPVTHIFRYRYRYRYRESQSMCESIAAESTPFRRHLIFLHCLQAR
jgi:hypothetical protein